MRKIITIVMVVFVSNLNFGQSIFDTLEDMDGVSYTIVNKDAFEILSKFKEKDNKDKSVEIFKLIKNLEELKVFKTEDATISKKMREMVKKAVKKSNLTQLMRARDKKYNVKIYVKSSKNKDFVNEVLMYVGGMDKKTETAVILLIGVIDINKLSTIADTISKK